MAVAVLGLALLGQVGARANPMACGDEQKTCLAGCAKLLAAACVTSCRNRQALCMRNGCWEGASRYCGLLKK